MDFGEAYDRRFPVTAVVVGVAVFGLVLGLLLFLFLPGIASHGSSDGTQSVVSSSSSSVVDNGVNDDAVVTTGTIELDSGV